MQVYDPLRVKWVELTPEEHVRQAFTAHLIQDLGYPAARMGNEVSLRLNGTLRRSDTVVYGRDRRPLMIVEYKAPHIPVTQKVFEQVVRYNIILKARILVVSNGLRHHAVKVDYTPAPVLTMLAGIPSWTQVEAGS